MGENLDGSLNIVEDRLDEESLSDFADYLELFATGDARMTIKYPEIKVQLTGTDGNVFAVLGKVIKVLKDNGVPQKEIDAFWEEATSGDYDTALATCMKWIEVS